MSKSMTEDLSPGTLLNERYQIVKRIGGGGMGSVYQALDKRLSDRLVAVKEMIQSFSDETQHAKAVDDFLREAQLLASLDHPSIPTIYDYFIEGGRYYLVMYYIKGRDLEAEMERRSGKIDEKTVTGWAIQVCDVLAYVREGAGQKALVVVNAGLTSAKQAVDIEGDFADGTTLVDAIAGGGATVAGGSVSLKLKAQTVQILFPQ